MPNGQGALPVRHGSKSGTGCLSRSPLMGPRQWRGDRHLAGQIPPQRSGVGPWAAERVICPLLGSRPLEEAQCTLVGGDPDADTKEKATAGRGGRRGPRCRQTVLSASRLIPLPTRSTPLQSVTHEKLRQNKAAQPETPRWLFGSRHAGEPESRIGTSGARPLDPQQYLLAAAPRVGRQHLPEHTGPRAGAAPLLLGLGRPYRMRSGRRQGHVGALKKVL
jgi:hypothetical protein